MIMLGFLLQWPTLLTLAMFPVLFWMYVWLARAEEREVARLFGDERQRWAARTGLDPAPEVTSPGDGGPILKRGGGTTGRPEVARAVADPQRSGAREAGGCMSALSWASVEGLPVPLGATWIAAEEAWNFAVYSEHAPALRASAGAAWTARDLGHEVTLAFLRTPCSLARWCCLSGRGAPSGRWNDEDHDE